MAFRYPESPIILLELGLSIRVRGNHNVEIRPVGVLTADKGIVGAGTKQAGQ
jgi:hypothetical protein